MTGRFEEALVACIRSIPPGKVATCGSVARALGDVRAARAVAAWLVAHPALDPERQVVRTDGRPVLTPAPDADRGAGTRNVDPGLKNRLADRLDGRPLLAALREDQERLARSVREEDEPGEVRTLGGVDASYVGDRAFAAAVSLDAASLEILEICEREVEVDFPYVPSYLAFREFPAVRAAVSGLGERPDVLFIDGHGRLHPVLFGFACYAGVSLDMPTIGIAKHALVGSLIPSRRREDGAIPIEFAGEVRGFAWIPPRAARAFYVSVGNRIGLTAALQAAQKATRERYPEPLRVADRISKERKRKKMRKEMRQG